MTDTFELQTERRYIFYCSLDHTELLHPAMFDAPSVAKPMQFARLWPHLFISSSVKLNIFSPVASWTGIKPINPVTISFLLVLKIQTNIHKYFCVEMSVDSSIMMVYFLSWKSSMRSGFSAGEMMFLIKHAHLLLCNFMCSVYSYAYVLSWFHSGGQLYVSHNGRLCLQQFAALLP
jgi:hypothetical protein